ncbi:hypothetical protein VK792_13830 [Mesobacterium sp. TK19101]|uniref:Uncharacterized protein n=1 Tax=Mesobacterium hydrothermale TaxID=3111907 RepID=A0ABU6HIS5_9RHOB|nr:hypothetical protein [Mesobacterium sp. TK19101]MEC3862369.1 hypothetical protein [Mesobacterium sp. TK19101]
MTDGEIPDNNGPTTPVASAWNALCCLPATHTWLWLARSGPVETAPAIGLVLLDALPGLLDAIGAGAFCHG